MALKGKFTASLALASHLLLGSPVADAQTLQDSFKPPVVQVEERESSTVIEQKLSIRSDQFRLFVKWYKGGFLSNGVLRSHILEYYDPNEANPVVLPKYDAVVQVMSEIVDADKPLTQSQFNALREALSKVETFYKDFLPARVKERQADIEAARKAGKRTDELESKLKANIVMQLYTQIFADAVATMSNTVRNADVSQFKTSIAKPSHPLFEK